LSKCFRIFRAKSKGGQRGRGLERDIKGLVWISTRSDQKRESVERGTVIQTQGKGECLLRRGT